ncbi:heme ABC transporter ATP-binding protein [Sphingobacterium paludis]|uniref:ABC-type hemin transport system ATPase subunit n=1 Tax=Sphingobacterium paludis TaxID=1476465 RepID=A0A4R7CSR6_9SPHI|nr:heme ABC transporter ATP-binding protein [Sphingobacterium paludis]TDS07456.1 ABC-type hemin transport system ATPase subunit [Sphingobacterium paludis]
MLRVEKVHYEVKGRKLLRDVSLQIRKGEVVALLGSNGAGKSTLMKVLCGEYRPTSGVVTLNGKRLDRYDPRTLARSRAMLSQQQHVSLAFTVDEIVMMGRYPHFKSSPSLLDKEVVEEVMALCGVDMLAHRIFMSLSGGEQQRVQLARTLAQVWENPDSLLLLDEPISALDMHYQQKVLAIAKALSRRGFMVVLVVHEVNFAATYADRIIMLKHGRKLFDGTPVEVLNPANIYTVFSVEASVELNPRTLRPYVRLEEMPVDVFKINSKLQPRPLEAISLQQRREQLIAKNPYLRIAEQAAALHVPEVELWIIDKGRRAHFIHRSLEDVIRQFSELGPVWVYTQNACCTQRTMHTYEATAFGGSAQHAAESFATTKSLQYDISRWHAGLLVTELGDEGMHFFNNNGELIHGVQLCDNSNKDAFCAVAAWLEKEANEKPQFQPAQKTTTVDPESLAFQHCQKRSIDMADVRKMFATAAASASPLALTTINEGCEHRYVGSISNVVDQGFRYILKHDMIELELRLPLVDQIYLTALPSDDVVVEFFDHAGKLNLRVMHRPAKQGSVDGMWQTQEVVI